MNHTLLKQSVTGWFLVFSLLALIFPISRADAAPDKVKVGLFVTQLLDFDMPKHTFNVVFWSWFIHPNQDYKPLQTVEIINSKSLVIKNADTMLKEPVNEKSDNKLWYTQGKLFAQISQEWNVEHFPFDRQVLEIVLEDGENETSTIQFEPDIANSKIAGSVQIFGWTVEDFKIRSQDFVYETTFGDPSLSGNSFYSRIIATITIKRQGFRLLCSLFIGFFVAFTLVSLTYFLDIHALIGQRVTLCSGAIFAATGNKYIVDNSLPSASTFTLADSLILTTFANILFAILIIILIQPNLKTRPKLALWINRAGAMISISFYLIWNGLTIWRATV
ncbi:MAG: hypothetical protein HQL93_11750 [Magnetococcales bacterium]|nr:hypothetical protein [Magnetococcales bacterium]